MALSLVKILTSFLTDHAVWCGQSTQQALEPGMLPGIPAGRFWSWLETPPLFLDFPPVTWGTEDSSTSCHRDTSNKFTNEGCESSKCYNVYAQDCQILTLRLGHVIFGLLVLYAWLKSQKVKLKNASENQF